MKSLTGKFTSVRGWALLLALLLGAGMMISACGDEEVPTPTTPEPPAPTPTPPAPEPTPEPTGPATPENLRVSAATSSSLTWTWDAVEAVLGYQGQFSTDAVFTDSDPTFLIIAPMTSHTVSNLSGNMTGHFRVRSGAGTSLTDLQYSEWSDGTPGTTSAPPAAVALDAPDNVRSTDRSEDSITVEWDDVDDADTYEVEQREPDDDWSDASCGASGADNVVDDEECVASDLDSGTDYDFRVRAVPADDDDAHTASDWSDIAETRTDGTSPVETATPTASGMGALKVTWEADSDGITWSWEPVAGATYQWKVVTADLDFEAEDPCGVDGFGESGTEFSETSTATGSALLCVRTMDEDDDMKDLSWAFATAVPSTAPTVGDITPAGNSGERTRALTWGGIGAPANFRYDISIVAEGGGVSDAPTGDDLQEACSAVSLHESDDTDVPLTALNTTFRSSPQPYTGYLLCLRYGNERGETDWVAAAAKHYTAPGQAPRPAKDSALSNDDLDSNIEKIVWNVATRNASGVPRLATGYNLKVIEHPSRNDGDDTDTLHDDTVTRPTAKTCEEITDGAPYSVEADPGTGTTSSGFTVEYTADRPDTLVDVRTTGTTQEILAKIVSLCIQAKYGDSDAYQGPWQVSGAETVAKMRPPS